MVPEAPAAQAAMLVSGSGMVEDRCGAALELSNLPHLWVGDGFTALLGRVFPWRTW